MRTEKEMMELIIKVANEDERVRAVGMNGSRTNSNVPKDNFKDYDIVYLVSDFQSFLDNPDWVDVFGKRIIMQTPEDMELIPPELDGRFTYLMLFEDGNRIDLMLIPIEEKNEYCSEDGLTIILLDKDENMPTLAGPTDEGYWVKKPSAVFFADCCNEFWWISTNVVKGLSREEILYAYEHLNSVREMLLTMLEWKVGIETNFSLSVGKNSKYLERYANKDIWESLLKTYPNGEYKQGWDSLFEMIHLFEQVAIEVADVLEYQYPYEEANKVKDYLIQK
ncbi:aminoglycoside 6-adenylyltransferase [Bacillus cereus]|uniref:Aminoglycoside 6-adenylyltransferase n=1 Tax=Bacillus cereus TaxID=1396 RepID=A0A9X8ZNK9_BACCE|nr:aminoglycoside 6-adenylyltransferase [Bacillus cereus]TKH22254.1 aminoglycoside 6-adenylyltransferase [Bacillus cereus]TKJ08143.1 aminoglycoside 6-adenylyltransferase [Bacillus cereus]